MTEDPLRILGVRTHYKDSKGNERLSAVDWWRVVNPLTHLAKNTHHKVDFINKVVDENGNVEAQWEEIGGNYDIIYTSYIDTPKAYAWIKASMTKGGGVHIMDLDDNIFSVDKMAPATLRYYPGSKDLENASIILGDVDLLVTSTPYLASVTSNYRQGPIAVMENYIDPEMFVYDPKMIKEHDKIIIGYQGSATHFSDLMNTGVMWALKRIMAEYENVRFQIYGSMYPELERFIPKDRLKFIGGERDFGKYVDKLWKTMPIDIGIAPLIYTPFNKAKSAIKYFEYGLRQIPGVYSWCDQYLEKVQHGVTGYIARDEEEWYYYLKQLVESADKRQSMGQLAQKDIRANYNIKDQWQRVQSIIEEAYDRNYTSNTT